MKLFHLVAGIEVLSGLVSSRISERRSNASELLPLEKRSDDPSKLYVFTVNKGEFV